MSYEVKRIDLAAATVQDQRLVPPGKRISEFFILDMPAGASFKLKVGDANPYIPVTRPFTMEPTGEDEANNGLLWANDAAQAGVTVDIVIVYGGAELSPVLT
jgi:hypothetical protein